MFEDVFKDMPPSLAHQRDEFRALRSAQADAPKATPSSAAHEG
jgi:hypothetical protein